MTGAGVVQEVCLGLRAHLPEVETSAENQFLWENLVKRGGKSSKLGEIANSRIIK